MKENGNKNASSVAKKAALLAENGAAKITGLYDHSITAHTAKKIRDYVLSLSIRSIGVFLLTFGIYSILIASILLIFTDISADISSIYGGVIISVCSLPLILSRGNISTSLAGSAIGSIICDHLNIRKDTIERYDLTGHLSISFILGVVAGGATLLFPFTSVIAVIAVAIMIGIILCIPETGLTFTVILMFFTDERIHYVILGTTILSFIFKLIRRKRSLSFKKKDIIFLIFALATAGSYFFTAGEDAQSESLAYVLFLSPYLLCVLMPTTAKKITKLLTVSVNCAGTVSSLYILAVLTERLADFYSSADKGFLLSTVSSMHAFESGFAPFAMAALIPVCTAFIIKTGSAKDRFSMILCLASMTFCLFIREELAFIAAAFIATAILLLIIGSRWVYLTLSSTLFVIVMLAFAGSFGDRLYRYIYRHIYEAYHQAEKIYAVSERPLSSDYIFCGKGFVNMENASGFYNSLISHLGIAGALVFTVFVLFILFAAIRLIIRTYAPARSKADIHRFTGADDMTNTRVGIVAAFCSLISVFISATFFDLYSCPLSYLTAFLLMGVCSSYTGCTVAEIRKAKDSLNYKNSKESASIVIDRQHS